MARLPRNEKQTYRLNSRVQMWPSGLTSPMTLTFNFRGQIYNLLYLSQKWSDCHETKSKHIDWTPRPQMWPSRLTLAMTLTLNFQGQIWNFLYLSQKWSDCYRTKSKHNYGTPNRTLMPIFWYQKIIFWYQKISIKVLFGVPYISIEPQASNVTNGFDLDHNLDLWILKVKRDLDLWLHTWSNFEIAVSQNGRADWHCTKGVAVGYSWPWPWPFGDQGQVYGSTR